MVAGEQTHCDFVPLVEYRDYPYIPTILFQNCIRHPHEYWRTALHPPIN